ncbi:MAG: hypothetical protein L0H96_19340 [Humibacillus sp.]|nr:hypothetical protein [Humibacillus sp.]MDN5779053.1 hypothetical protein [Humibacillus sp.]
MTAVEWADYPLFEYEKDLARREIEALVGRDVLSFEAQVDASDAVLLRQRATYLRAVSGGGISAATAQAEVEDLHRSVRGRKTKRQSTRFLVHGLHEYKGKFNPQLARALVNVVDPSCTALIDPFCGSGTTLVEGLRLGLEVGGIDKNPLAVWLTGVKVDVLRASGEDGLAGRHLALSEKITTAMDLAQSSGRAEVPQGVEAADEAYLRNWFPQEVLAALWAALDICYREPSLAADVARVNISSLVRSISWQMPEDLRVRRRNKDWTPPRVADLFAVAAAQAHLALREVGGAAVVAGDLRAEIRAGSSADAETVAAVVPDGRRLVVTSPPYATALPYIDTDRLSIVLLGLGSAVDIRRLEQNLTGSREWNTGVARAWAEAWETNRDSLPSSVLDLLGTIQASNERTDAGFRRAAVPTLLYRYFSQIGQTLDNLAESLKVGERAVFVVGTNRTGKGEGLVEIATPRLLAAVAATRGFRVDEIIPLETWPRYGMHADNAVNSEDAVVLTVEKDQGRKARVSGSLGRSDKTSA